MKKTLFIDIDGTLVRHKGNLSNVYLEEPELLPGVIDKLNKWNADGHKIILTTGRPESMRKITNEQLEKFGIFYDQLIMGLTRGERIVINDKKPSLDITTASAIQVNRNEGLINININV
jgi:uncharacterized HAD superfamily protein